MNPNSPKSYLPRFVLTLIFLLPVRLLAATSAVSAGNNFSLFLKSNGTVWATGRNSDGQLGDGSNLYQRHTPVQVMTGVQAISAGSYHSLFLKTDGSAWAAGWNSYGQLGDGASTSGLRRSTPVLVMTGVQAISAGSGHSLFLKADGSVWATGHNYFGELGDGTTTQRSTPLQVMTEVRSISAGYSHSLFLKENGTVWATGRNHYDQLGDGTTTDRSTPVQVMTDVRAISGGEQHSLFLKTGGTAWGAGANYVGQIGHGITTEFGHSPPVPVMTGVQSISAGQIYSMFLKTDGTVWATGWNLAGQLGDGTTTDHSTPVQVMTDVQSVSSSFNHSLFIKTTGTVWATGSNDTGQLGDGTTSGRLTPSQVQLPTYGTTAWQREQFGADADNPLISGWEADPDHDGVVNLLERAFNLSPLQAAPIFLDGTAGTAGLPSITVTPSPGGPALMLQYVRLRSSPNYRIIYMPQFSSSLNEDEWFPATGAETVEFIDLDWERVTIQESTAEQTKCFGRVKVSTSP